MWRRRSRKCSSNASSRCRSARELSFRACFSGSLVEVELRRALEADVSEGALEPVGSIENGVPGFIRGVVRGGIAGALVLCAPWGRRRLRNSGRGAVRRGGCWRCWSGAGSLSGSGEVHRESVSIGALASRRALSRPPRVARRGDAEGASGAKDLRGGRPPLPRRAGTTVAASSSCDASSC